MVYKLTSRDNIDSDKFETWPAELSLSVDICNNKIIPHIYHSIDDILNWLECKSRGAILNNKINVQEFKNGDPNKMYSVYECNHEENSHGNELKDKYLFSFRQKKPHEAFSTFMNEKGERVKSSFKKININNETIDDVENYSSSVREIQHCHYEGILPYDIDENNPIEKGYMLFVTSVNNMDKEENKEKNYSIIYSDARHITSWLDCFIEKLDKVEKFLDFFARGGNMYFHLKRDPHNDGIINQINYMIAECDDKGLDEETISTINNIMKDPLISTSDIYQIRYGKSFLTWHRNYIHMLKQYKIIPSKEFADVINNFNLSDFFKQIQTKENLMKILNNLMEFLDVTPKNNIDNYRLIGKTVTPKPKFHKVTKSFNSK